MCVCELVDLFTAVQPAIQVERSRLAYCRCAPCEMHSFSVRAEEFGVGVTDGNISVKNAHAFFHTRTCVCVCMWKNECVLFCLFAVAGVRARSFVAVVVHEFVMYMHMDERPMRCGV